MASSSNSPCAACKFLRRKCTQECVFAPYFPPDHPQRFAHVHKVFGASNVSKLLNDLNPTQREDAVNSLAYEAEARLNDPVYGIVGLISMLQFKLKQIHHDLHIAKKELAAYVGPSAMLPLSHPHHMLNQGHNIPTSNAQYAGMPGPTPGAAPPSSQAAAQFLMREQQMFDAQQLAAALAAREQQEMMRNYGQQQQQQQENMVHRFNGGFEGAHVGTGFPQMNAAASPTSMSLAASPSSVALAPFENPFQVQQEQDHVHQHHPHHSSHNQKTESDDGRSLGTRPSSS